MVQSFSFIIELLEKIGVPFVGAVEAVSVDKKTEDTEAAKMMAQMLTQAVQAGIGVSESITMPEDVGEADSVRLALTTLTGSVIADFHRQHKRLPEAADIEKIVKSFQTVLPFAENFSGAASQSSRLSLLGKNTLIFDETQIGLVIAQIMTPVMNAIHEFPFGQPETKLLQEVLAKLQAYAGDFAKVAGDGSKLGEIMILKALADIYTTCHRAETERLMKADDAVRAELSLDGVWKLFDKRIAMIELVAGLNDSRRTEPVSTTTDNVTPTSTTQEVTPAPVAPSMPEPPPTQPAVPVTPSPAQQVPPAAAAGAGPMGFFAKKPQDSGSQIPQTEAPQQIVQPDVPAAPVQPVAPPPADTPPPAAPIETTPPPPPAEENNAQAPANPMGFFKPGAKKEEE